MADLTFFSVTDPFAKPGNNTQVFGINASGQIVGSYADSSNNLHGFLYTDGTYVTLDFPAAIFTQALAINASVQIVGIYIDSNSKEHSFLFSNGAFSTIDDPAASLTIARGIDGNGNIVGISVDQTGEHAFIRRTNGVFSRNDPPGATLVEAHGINDGGQITGRFDNPATHGYVEINGLFTQLDVPVTNAFNTNAQGIDNAGQVGGTVSTRQQQSRFSL
jgi:probable HAF family extracellular repeat protein